MPVSPLTTASLIGVVGCHLERALLYSDVTGSRSTPVHLCNRTRGQTSGGQQKTRYLLCVKFVLVYVMQSYKELHKIVQVFLFPVHGKCNQV